jgi:hypothetical protein
VQRKYALEKTCSTKGTFCPVFETKEMPYRKEDWLELVLGLENAQDLLLQAKELPEKC